MSSSLRERKTMMSSIRFRNSGRKVWRSSPMTALAADPAEQFPGLTPGETYWFDLSGADIPGNKNGSLPDDSLHWAPFTYVGTVNAYVLKSRSANDNTARGDAAMLMLSAATGIIID